MDAVYAVRPAGGASGPTVRGDAATPRAAVPTELSPRQAVTQPGPSEAAADVFDAGGQTGRDAQARTRLRDFVQRRLVLDVEARTMVTQMVLATGEVVGQFPDQGTLKLRAYVRQRSAADSRPVSGDRRVEAVA